jgi:ureidoglycolate lyase
MIDPSSVRAFVTNGRQGVNYHRGTWHHPLIAVGDFSEFLVVDRAGESCNLHEQLLESVKLFLEAPFHSLPR